MTARTETRAAGKPRSRAGRKAIAAAVAVPLILAAIGQGLLAALTALIVAAVVVLVLRARWARYSAGGRVAAWRRRRHQGWATAWELTRAAAAARKLSRRISPGAGLLVLGSSRRRPVVVHRENSALYVGPPGYGKTGALACHAADAPGLLFATSTKTDLLLDTLPYRKGPVWVLNADKAGGIPSTLAWSPVEGCEDPATAIRRAGDFMAASPRDPTGKDAYHEDRAARLLSFTLHAAAVSGASMLEVAAWVKNPLSPQLMEILKSPAASPGWDEEFVDLLIGGRDGDWITGLIASTSAALGWMRDPAMKAAASPAPGGEFSIREFVRSGGSVYLIGKKRPNGSLAPYFAAFGGEIFEQLKQYAMESPSGRLPVPATFVLDEMPLTCPLPLHDMLAESRGPLITIVAAAQTLAQLHAKFGKEDGDTIRSACPVEVFTGGEKRIEDLQAVSGVIGDHDTWHGSMDDLRTQPLLPPGALRRLGKGKAIVLMPERRPVKVALPAIWQRPGHVRAGLGDVPVPARQSVSRPAIFPVPARKAIPAGMLRRIPVPVTSRPAPRVLPERLAIEPPAPVPAIEGEVVPWPVMVSSAS